MIVHDLEPTSMTEGIRCGLKFDDTTRHRVQQTYPCRNVFPQYRTRKSLAVQRSIVLFDATLFDQDPPCASSISL